MEHRFSASQAVFNERQAFYTITYVCRRRSVAIPNIMVRTDSDYHTFPIMIYIYFISDKNLVFLLPWKSCSKCMTDFLANLCTYIFNQTSAAFSFTFGIYRTI